MSRLDFPATRRNAAPIFAVLQERVPPGALVLELASGSGQHAASFAPRLPGVRWQPSDPDPTHRASIAAWTEDVDGVEPPLALDVHDPWPVDDGSVDVVFVANLLHISPETSSDALMRGAAACLREGGELLVYGPFLIDGAHISESNVAFDASLRRRDPRWGVRDTAALRALAARRGLLDFVDTPLPANNRMLRWRRGPRDADVSDSRG